MGGLVKAVKSVVDTVAPVLSMIPGIGQLAMAAKFCVDMGSNIMNAVSNLTQQDGEDAANALKQQATNLAQKADIKKSFLPYPDVPVPPLSFGIH